MQKANRVCLLEVCKREVTTGGYPIPFERPKVAEKWVAFLNQQPQSLPYNLEPELLCPLHFHEDSFLRKRGKITKKLNKKAFPTIVLPGMAPVQQTTTGYEDSNGSTTVAIKKRQADKESGDSESDDESDDESEDEDSQDVTICFFARRRESPLMFLDYSSEEDVGSDFEPVEANDIQTIIEKIIKKTEILRQDDASLQEMEDIISKQTKMITQLTWELDELKKAEAEQNKQDSDDTPTGNVDSEEISTKPSTSELKPQTEEILPTPSTSKLLSETIITPIPSTSTAKTEPEEITSQNQLEEDMNNVILSTEVNRFLPDYSNRFQKVFSISLLYFSPKTYAYVRSILRTLPPKEEILRWVQSGEVKNIMPAGLQLRENKFFDQV